jgi:hypothetical protein
MKKVNILIAASLGSILVAGPMSSAFATCVDAAGCTLDIASSTTNEAVNNTKNVVTTTFSDTSTKAGLALQSVYEATGVFSQKNTGAISSTGSHDQVITSGNGNGQLEVTGLGNNFSAELVGLRSVNLAMGQQNSGNIIASNTVRHPNVSGNLEVTTNAIGNNASVGWDLTTDTKPSNNAFDVKRDGAVRSFSTLGTYLGSIEQCNTGAITAKTDYMQDPAANIKVSTTAIGNNFSFGVKTR